MNFAVKPTTRPNRATSVTLDSKKRNNMSTKLKPLIVTTQHRGVFFGYGLPTTEKTVRLERVRMCVYWTTETHGVVGLAAKGPDKGCRIGPEAPAITLQDVTSIMEVSDVAEKKWQEEPWN